MERMAWLRISREFKHKAVWVETPDKLDSSFDHANECLPVPFYRVVPRFPPRVSVPDFSPPFVDPTLGVPSNLLPSSTHHLGVCWEKEVNTAHIQQWEYLPFSFISAIAEAVSLKSFFFPFILSLHFHPLLLLYSVHLSFFILTASCHCLRTSLHLCSQCTYT